MNPENNSFLDLLDRVGSAALLVNRRGHIVEYNRLAKHLIFCESLDPDLNSTDPFTSRTIQSALTDMFGTVELERPRRDRRLAFQALDLAEAGETHRLMILIDLSVRAQVCAPVLEKIFGLTNAEGRLAAELSNGVPLATIARERNVSIATLRTQLASIFGKTGTSRQPELVALLSRVCQLSATSGAGKTS